MNKLKPYCLVMGLIFSGFAYAVESGPLLISDLPPHQVYTESQLAAFEKSADSQLKGGELTGLEKDYQIYSQVLKINADNLSSKQREFLLQLTKHKPLAYKAHPEGPVAIPIYNIKSLAEHKLFQHDVAEKAEKMKPLMTGDTRQFAKNSLIDSTHLQAARKALKDSLPMSQSTLAELVTAYKSDNSSSSVTLLNDLVTLTGDKQAVYSLLEIEGKHWQKNQLINSLNNYLTAQEQEAELRKLISLKSELSSQAVLNYSRLPPSVTNSNLLYELLSDKILGPSSASALASSTQNQLDLNRLKLNIQNNPDARVTVANSLLALKLADSPEAKNVIRGLLEAGYIKFDDMKVEVSAWVK